MAAALRSFEVAPLIAHPHVSETFSNMGIAQHGKLMVPND